MQIHAKDIFFCFCIQVLACHTQYFASTFFHLMCLRSHHVSVFWSLSQRPTLCDLMDCSMPGSPVLHSQNLLKFLSIESVMLSYHLILCSLLLLLSSIFHSIRVFSYESTLHIRWPQYWSFSFGISPSNDYSGLLECRIDWLISLLSEGLSRVFSNTTVWKHRFFGAQPPLWSNCHIHTWLLEKLQPWLYGPLSTKWLLCFLIKLSRFVTAFVSRSKCLLISFKFHLIKLE